MVMTLELKYNKLRIKQIYIYESPSHRDTYILNIYILMIFIHIYTHRFYEIIL